MVRSPISIAKQLHRLTLRALYLRPGLIAKVLAVIAFFSIGIV